MDAYVIKLYDKCSKNWIQLTQALSLEEAEEYLAKLTDKGTKHCTPKHGDYYRIFRISAKNLNIKRYRK